MSFKRKVSYQLDILEWLSFQRTPLKILQREHYKNEKGFVAYFWSAVNFLKESRQPTKDDAGVLQKKQPDPVSRSMDQYYESVELTKRMKWKRVTWEEDADYTGFSKRIIDNDSMFKGVPAFSFMSIHVVKDPCTTDLVKIPEAARTVEMGSLTNWVLREREPQIVELYPTKTVKERKSAFTVDWSSGEVKILDTASAQEVLTFLNSVAPRLQALQVKMEEQQTRQAASVEHVRVRVGATLKFNEFDTCFWDDPKRKVTKDYVNPDEMEKFLKGILKSAFLYRYFLKGQRIRVVPPGKPYYADLDKMELQIPTNFAEYNWYGAHARFEGVEKRSVRRMMSRSLLMKESFELLQKDGKIPKASVSTALRAAGLNPSEEKIKEIMSSVGDLDMAAYEALVAHHDDKTDTPEAVMEAFRVFDKEGNGTVSVAEFRHIMTTMGEKFHEDEFVNLIQGFDENGVIHYGRFVEKMLAPFTEHCNYDEMK